jgi:hypothetical protein
MDLGGGQIVRRSSVMSTLLVLCIRLLLYTLLLLYVLLLLYKLVLLYNGSKACCDHIVVRFRKIRDVWL